MMKMANMTSGKMNANKQSVTAGWNRTEHLMNRQKKSLHIGMGAVMVRAAVAVV